MKLGFTEVVLHCCQEMNAITIVSQVGAPTGTDTMMMGMVIYYVYGNAEI